MVPYNCKLGTLQVWSSFSTATRTVKHSFSTVEYFHSAFSSKASALTINGILK